MTAPASLTAAPLSWADTYRRYAPLVLRRARRFFDGPEAEEVTQEIFVKLLARSRADGASAFAGQSSITTWLYRLTTNHCIDRLRVQKRRSQLLEQHATDFAPETDSGRQEQRALIGQLFADLDEDLAQMGIHYFADGMTHTEIARVIGCSPRTVGNRLDALRTELRARVEREGRT